MKKYTLAVLVFLFALNTLVLAEPRPIRFKNGTLELSRQTPEQVATALQSSAGAQRRHVIVQFDEPVTDEQRAKLEAAGVKLLDYLGDNGYFASVASTGLNSARLRQVGGLSRVGAIAQPHKLHAELLFDHVYDWMVVGVKHEPVKDGETPDAGRQPIPQDPTVGVYVRFHSDVSLEQEAAKIVRKHGAAIRSYIGIVNTLVIELPYSKIKPLAEEDAVAWIEPPLPGMSETNDGNRARTGADVVQAAPYSLNGAGVQALVYDGGRVLTTHVDFQGRAQVGSGELPCTAVSNHSTHVAGTIAGGGVANPNLKGMAPGADIISYGLNQGGGCSLSQGFLYTDPGDISTDYAQAINTYGADVANNSIGTNTAPNGFPCSWEGDYGVTDTVIDAIARGSVSPGGAPFRICWANGNERGSGACGTTYHTTAPPACAKNHITCGALNSNDDSVTSFTSWGPADDDRMKPDISGPGCQVGGDAGVTSCSSSSTTAYASLCGTSMATPTITGLSALLLQDFRIQFPALPDFRGSTLKILFAHTAIDLFNAGPDYQTGYGSVRIQPAIDFMRTGNFLENSVSQGGTYNVYVIVNAGQTPLKVTLAWDDPPGTPNVSPALVNDLDLVVFDPSNAQRFPWTLGGNANPSAAAVQTQKNAVDNIEQVFVNNPASGIWRVEVRGFNVPSGPQPFSLCASPSLINCSNAGIISLDKAKYPCSSTATITVNDCGLNTDDLTVQTVNVTIASTSEPGGETVLLTESGPATALFQGSISLSTSNSAGVLQVANGDTVTATYVDADDGMGGFNINVTANATVDCTPPVISNVQTTNIQARNATVTFTTDEAAKGTVRWGTSCGSLTNSATEGGFGTSHSLAITSLNPNTTYYYSVEAVDTAGNLATDNNGGSCYSFMTPNIPELFTEIFESADNDLSNKMILFTPDPGISHYKACTFNAAALPTDPTGGTTITTWTGTADDGNAVVTVGAGQTVKLHNLSYGSFFVGTNGYITFNSGETDYTESLADHFGQPRVAALFDDLNPGTGGSVSYKQLADRIAVTWLNVPEYSTTNSNTFQIELFFDGRITITYLAIAATDGLAGLSPGGGLSPDYFESDLSNQSSGCGPLPPVAVNSSFNATTYVATNTSLIGSDPNGDPMVFTILSLPARGTLTDPGASQITSVPYTLVGGGNVVRYRSICDYSGADSFTFKVTANGDDSNVATVSVNVIGPVTSFFFDDFPALTFDGSKWVSATATIDTVGTAEPSEPNSARFNGDPSGGDAITSKVFNLAAESGVTLTYWFEQRGGGESPDAGDDLIVEYLNAAATWVEISRQLGSGPDMTTYQKVDISLPAGAYHANFQFRIRNTATTGAFDDWFVDDVGMTKPILLSVCSCIAKGDVNKDGQINGKDAQRFAEVAVNPGYADVDEFCAADCDNSLSISPADVDPFVTILLSQP